MQSTKTCVVARLSGLRSARRLRAKQQHVSTSSCDILWHCQPGRDLAVFWGLSVRYFQNSSAPIKRCESSTATATLLSNARPIAARTSLAASSARSARSTWTAIARTMAGVSEPVGTCHKLKSPHSPRMMTRERNGTRQLAITDSALAQFPAPEDCIRRAACWSPRQAPAASAISSSSVVSTIARIAASASAREQPQMAGIRHPSDPSGVRLQYCEEGTRPRRQFLRAPLLLHRTRSLAAMLAGCRISGSAALLPFCNARP